MNLLFKLAFTDLVLFVSLMVVIRSLDDEAQEWLMTTLVMAVAICLVAFPVIAILAIWS